ncbi:MurR/RpiR family transcriptional regulator [Agromyces neolithicus]
MGERPLSEVVRESLDSLSSGERKVGRAILANYPIAGLETVAELAQRANVSPPTVVRFASRLGFSGYPAFQKRLVREVHERLGSPLEQYAREDLRSGDSDLARASRIFSSSIASTIGELPVSEFERAVSMLTDLRHPVRLIGGRFSHLLAEYLGAHLKLLRPDVEVIGADEFARLAAVADTRRGDVFAVFDYRRYDPHVIRLSQRVTDRGADLVLFTDRWLSPAADVASTVLPANVDAPSPFDSLVPAMAVVETAIAGVTDRLGESGRQRLEDIENLRGRAAAERSG